MPTGGRSCWRGGASCRRLREWFRKRGFLEVETPALQVSPGNEVHLHAFATELVTPAADRQPLYLHTSPEFTCKKLLAAGEARVFSLGHVFRNRERGPLHHPEFTMLEWYRSNEPYEALMQDCAAILDRGREGGGLAAIPVEGAHRRSLCGAGAARRRRRFHEIRRHRSAGDAEVRRARPRHAGERGACGRHRCRRRRHLVGRVQPRAGRTHRAEARPRPRRAARPLSLAGGGVGRSPTATRGWRSASSFTPAASNWPTASPN